MGWRATRRERGRIRVYDELVHRLIEEKGGERVVEDAGTEDRRPDKGEGESGDKGRG